MCTPDLVSTTHPGCHCPPTSIGTPPTHLLALCHYHHSSPIDSKLIFCSKPCQNRHAFENFRFFMHWACTHTTRTTRPLCCHLGRLLVCLCVPLCTLVHPQCTFHAPSTHPCTPFCAPFSRLVTLIQLSSDLRPPSGYHGQPSPSATRHSAHSRPLYNQVQPLQPPCSPSAFPVGLHKPHSHSRIRSSWVTICQSSTHFSLC